MKTRFIIFKRFELWRQRRDQSWTDIRNKSVYMYLLTVVCRWESLENSTARTRNFSPKFHKKEVSNREKTANSNEVFVFIFDMHPWPSNRNCGTGSCTTKSKQVEQCNLCAIDGLETHKRRQDWIQSLKAYNLNLLKQSLSL